MVIRSNQTNCFVLSTYRFQRVVPAGVFLKSRGATGILPRRHGRTVRLDPNGLIDEMKLSLCGMGEVRFGYSILKRDFPV